jgi:hypothetical protein
MAGANKSGKTSLFMKATGEIIRPTAGGDLFTPTVMYMKGSGKMTKRMAKVFIITTMVPATMGNGMKTFNKDLEFKNGLMVHLMKGIFLSIF